MNLTPVRCQYVHPVSFRKTEATNYEELPDDVKALLKTPHDVVCFVSMSRDQVVFVSKPGELKTTSEWRKRSKARKNIKGLTVIYSRRLRLPRGAWNPLMLANYAQQLGLKLIGIKKFEEHYKQLAAVTPIRREPQKRPAMKAAA